jgi:hypothetical protein
VKVYLHESVQGPFFKLLKTPGIVSTHGTDSLRYINFVVEWILGDIDSIRRN